MGQDIDFWRTWIWQLQLGGYSTLEGNYPPLILHWFRILAWLLSAMSITPQDDSLIKIYVLLPVLFSHLFLVDLVGRALVREGENPLRSGIFWLTAGNPALLINGPMWGQIDLLPFIPLYYAIRFSLNPARAHWALSCLAIALLCKFQAIVLVPLITGLLVRHWRKQLVGGLLALAVFAIGFLPFYLGGADVIKAMERAYWGNLGIYPYSTLNAANLWYLVSGKSYQPDSISLLTGDWLPPYLAALLTPSRIGLLLFGLVSIFVFFSAIRTDRLPKALSLAVFSLLGFFAFSSAMHERYLFLAVPAAALWASCDARARFWYPVLTLVVYINTNFILALSGAAAWIMLSSVVVVSFPLMLAQLLAPAGVTRVWQGCLTIAGRYPSSAYIGLLCAWLAVFVLALHNEVRLAPHADLSQSEVQYLSAIAPEHYQQDWGELHMNKNLEDKRICVGGRCYEQGIATHAKSIITYRIPPEANRFAATVGLDDHSAGGSVAFSVVVDDEELWNSGPMSTEDGGISLDVPVTGKKWLRLVVDPLDSNLSDHADWAEARFLR